MLLVILLVMLLVIPLVILDLLISSIGLIISPKYFYVQEPPFGIILKWHGMPSMAHHGIRKSLGKSLGFVPMGPTGRESKYEISLGKEPI